MGEVLEFRHLSRADLAFLLEVRNECRQMLHDSRSFALAESEVWFEQYRPDFRIILRGGIAIGYFRLSNYDPQSRSIYIGADLHPAFRGRGLGRAAYSAFLPLVVAEFGLVELRLEVLSHNTRALELYESIGFRETGRLLDFCVRGGEAVDSILMSLAWASQSA